MSAAPFPIFRQGTKPGIDRFLQLTSRALPVPAPGRCGNSQAKTPALRCRRHCFCLTFFRPVREHSCGKARVFALNSKMICNAVWSMFSEIERRTALRGTGDRTFIG
jgi:hypothetical protein